MVSFTVGLLAEWRQLTCRDVLFENKIDHTPQANPILCRGAIGDGQTVFPLLDKRLRGYLCPRVSCKTTPVTYSTYPANHAPDLLPLVLEAGLVDVLQHAG